MNRPAIVSRIIYTTKFRKAYKLLSKKKMKNVIKDIDSTIMQLVHFEITSQRHNHPLKGKNNKGINDIHIRGDIILLYRYLDDDTLSLALELTDLVNHKELSKNY